MSVWPHWSPPLIYALRLGARGGPRVCACSSAEPKVALFALSQKQPEVLRLYLPPTSSVRMMRTADHSMSLLSLSASEAAQSPTVALWYHDKETLRNLRDRLRALLQPGSTTPVSARLGETGAHAAHATSVAPPSSASGLSAPTGSSMPAYFGIPGTSGAGSVSALGLNRVPSVPVTATGASGSSGSTPALLASMFRTAADAAATVAAGSAPMSASQPTSAPLLSTPAGMGAHGA
ncbi:MAG: hypothetical protein EOO65_02940, partial [Methanosarcinales archaeon]